MITSIAAIFETFGTETWQVTMLARDMQLTIGPDSQYHL